MTQTLHNQITRSEEETHQWAQSFARELRPGQVVALSGPLGAGKTVVCRGISQALGFKGPVTSPSYALVNEYSNDPPIYHIDLYRLGPRADWEEIGVEHYFSGDGICLVEWPERLEHAGNIWDFHLHLERTSESERRIRVTRG